MVLRPELQGRQDVDNKKARCLRRTLHMYIFFRLPALMDTVHF